MRDDELRSELRRSTTLAVLRATPCPVVVSARVMAMPFNSAVAIGWLPIEEAVDVAISKGEG